VPSILSFLSVNYSCQPAVYNLFQGLGFFFNVFSEVRTQALDVGFVSSRYHQYTDLMNLDFAITIFASTHIRIYLNWHRPRLVPILTSQALLSPLLTGFPFKVNKGRHERSIWVAIAYLSSYVIFESCFHSFFIQTISLSTPVESSLSPASFHNLFVARALLAACTLNRLTAIMKCKERSMDFESKSIAAYKLNCWKKGR